MRAVRVPFSFSRLSTRILAIMLLPLCLFMIGLFSVGQYKHVLITAELDALERQGVVLARSLALAEADQQRVVSSNTSSRYLSPNTMKQLLPLVGYGSILRARVFQPDGQLAADTSRDGLTSGRVRWRMRRDRPFQDRFADRLISGLNAISSYFSMEPPMPDMPRSDRRRAGQMPVIATALNGQITRDVFRNHHGHIVLSVALPVQDVRAIKGALWLTTSGGRIEQEIKEVQWAFLQIFGFVTLVTIGLAIYLARSITTPIAKLAGAADKLRRSHDHEPLDRLPNRKDEIGDLSKALHDMTDELQRRIQATAGFAADVSHELKNPLTSLRSAVETVARIEDAAQQRKLMDVILADVGRLDRLITDISLASRIDVELNRLLPDASDLAVLLHNWHAVSQERNQNLPLIFICDSDGIPVRMFATRIVQILDNLLQNAISFSPEKGKITVRVETDKDQAVIHFDDQGPGIPEAKKEAIFERFYTERPATESFGNHSGLGLSISRQIAEAHNGTLQASNLKDGGARFTLTLPVERS